MVKNEKDLADAINQNQDYIEIEGDLANKVIKIKATNKIAWGVLISVTAVAIVAIIYKDKQSPNNITEEMNKISAVTKYIPSNLIESIGAGVVASIVAIAISSGGITALYKLRNYKLEKISDQHIKLIKD